MTLKAFPFDSVDTTETEYSLLFQQLQDDGISAAPGSTAGQVTAGSGMQVNVAAFPLAVLAGFAMYSDAVEQLTLTAGGSQPRIDRVVLRVDPTSNLSAIAVLEGVPAVTPTVSALTQNPGGVWEVSLAQIAVGVNAVNVVAGNITDERVFLSTRVGAWTTATRKAVAGRLGFNFTTGKMEFYDGGAWVTVGDTTWASISNKPTTFAPIIGTASNQAKAGNWVPAWTDVQSKPTSFPPSAHTHPWGDITGEPATYPPIIGAASNQAVAGNDPRLTDARTPKPHTHPISDVTSLQAALDGKQPSGNYYYPGNSQTASNTPSNGTAGGSNSNVQLDVQWLGDGNLNPTVYNRSLPSNYKVAYINSAGTLGYAASSERFKQDIADATLAEQAVLALRLVTFRYIEAVKKFGDEAAIEWGLIAEEVVAAGLDWLVFYDENGRPEGVRYERLALALLPVLQDHERRLAVLEGK